MGGRTHLDRDPAGLRSDIYWAVLGLIIARPSYGYELAQRYERTFGALLPLSSQGQIYKGLASLEEKGLIEKVPVSGDERQPKTHYRASARGAELYQVRLVARASEEARRSREFGEELATLPPAAALLVLDAYEEACLAEAEHAHASRPGEARPEALSSLAGRLSAHQMHASAQARLSWIDYARREFRALAEQERIQ